jgi:hypothetical protein
MNMPFTLARVPPMYSLSKTLKSKVCKGNKTVIPMSDIDASSLKCFNDKDGGKAKPNCFIDTDADDLEISDNESVHSIDVPVPDKRSQTPPFCRMQSTSMPALRDDRPTGKVTFHDEVLVHHYHSCTDITEHSKLFYNSQDYRRFEVEADMETRRKRLQDKIQVMQKCKSTVVDEEQARKREALLSKIASQYYLNVQ